MINVTTYLKRKNRNAKKDNSHNYTQVKTPYDLVVPKMTQDEHYEYMCLLACGQHDVRNKTILVGSDLMDKIDEFKKRMIEKYK